MYAFGLLIGLGVSAMFATLESNFMALIGLRLKSAALGRVWERILGPREGNKFDTSGELWCVQEASEAEVATGSSGQVSIEYV